MKRGQSKSEFLLLKQDHLRTHPQNMRRFYPPDDVRQMADSIRAAQGVIHPLIVVPNGKKGMYYVVDGNMRLAGARSLGAECPPLQCKLVDEKRAQQLLTMVIANKLRFDPDPISEAIHYQRLVEEEGYSMVAISRATGVAQATIKSRLQLLDLDPEIQDLISQGKFPSDARASAALLTIRDRRVRVKLAQRLAHEGVTIRTIVSACERILENLEEKDAQGKASPTVTRTQKNAGRKQTAEVEISPALVLAQKKHGRKPPEPVDTVTWPQVRVAAQVMCDACEIKESQLQDVPEPAWELIAHAAESTCQRCNVRNVAGVCRQCPGVEILRALLNSNSGAK